MSGCPQKVGDKIVTKVDEFLRTGQIKESGEPALSDWLSREMRS